MKLAKNPLPQLCDKLFITDGGMETDLVFNHNIALPEFASYDLLRYEEGRATLKSYYEKYARLALSHGIGLILETPTWRTNLDWTRKIGDPDDAVERFNRDAVGLVADIRERFQTETSPIVVSGCLGPRGDGYKPGNQMTAEEARRYHTPQVEALTAAGADMVSALTLNYIQEAIGITQAARNSEIPVCISFTVETNGKLPAGDTLDSAIAAVDAATDSYPAYYMINCAHPTHFGAILPNMKKLYRLKAVRANASRCSHAELDEATRLDDGNPKELGRQLAAFRSDFQHINILGGCCGTDLRHIREVAECCTQAEASIA